MKKKTSLILVLTLALTGWLAGQSAPTPLNEKTVTKQLKKSPQQLMSALQQQGVDFEVTPEIENRLRSAGANDEMINAVKQATPTARAAQKAAHEEGQALGAIQMEPSPDRALQLVADFEKKYPQSPLLSYVYAYEGNAYAIKGEVPKVIASAEKALKLKEDNLMALVMIANMLAQPQVLREAGAAKNQKLAEAEKYANKALAVTDQLVRRPQDNEETFEAMKAVFKASAHSALGLVHLQRSLDGLAGPDKEELAKAEEEYKMAVTMTNRPNPEDYVRLAEAYHFGGKNEAAIGALLKAAELAPGTPLAKYAADKIEELKKAKERSSATPAKP